MIEYIDIESMTYGSKNKSWYTPNIKK